MKIIEAVHDENKKYKGGKAGDQTGDEVRVHTWRNFGYTVVARWKDRAKAEKYVKILKYWAENDNIGYDQGKTDRNTLYEYLKAKGWKDYKVTKKVETVCSNLAECGLPFCGVTVKKNTLSGKLLAELKKYPSTFEFLTDKKYLTSGDYLKAGDILIKNGHVAVAMEDGSKAKTTTTKTTTTNGGKKDMVVFLSAGHGGKDPGAVGNGLKEKDINLNELLACKEKLEKNGIKVVCSRTKDVDDPVEEEVKEANKSGADIAVSFHTNAGGGDGFEAYYYSGNKEGKKLAGLCETHIKDLGQKSRGLKTTNLMFTRSTKMTAVLLESFFIDNSNDVKLGDTVAKQKKIGEAYADAIMEYLGVKSGTAKATTSDKIYRVQVGAFTERGNAEKITKELKAKGYNAVIV